VRHPGTPADTSVFAGP
jgi:meso-butanediol dehydrogenase/(S,S)-butanediol dehydrogenase/diacetyl reductase